ncbi:CvpA family protein [Planctomicrobium sp. SH664]|uniref:CvpA family protein n=1 Tax=Planctomicrobium sp. SH664 TaxID=3448125 RepID=UPI003F5AFCA0
MWYDVLCVGVLLFFTLRGAARGVIWQIAGIAGIVLCFVFGNGISAAVGPYIRLESPLNHWVALFIAYLGFSFCCFGLGRALTGWMEKNQLKEFNQHLGAVFGLVKGVILCLVMTFLLVTVSSDMRAKLIDSHTGRYSAIIMDRLHPVMPEKLHDALAKYIHQLDHDGLDLDHRHDHDHDHEVVPNTNGSSPYLGTPTQFPQTQQPVATPTSSPLWSQLRGALSDQAQQVVSKTLDAAQDPQTRAKLEQDLLNLWNSVPAQDRAALQQQIINGGTTQLQNYLNQRLQPVTSTPQSIPVPPIANSAPVQTPAQPTTTPAPTAPSAGDRQAALIREIASAYSTIPNIRQGIERDIADKIAGLPESLAIAVLDDWNADAWSRPSDPDPQTTNQSTIEQRILRQLQLSGLTLDRLAPAIQQRLRAAQSPQAGNPL